MSSSTHSHFSSSSTPFSFLPPVIVYPLEASIPKTDPYKLFRSTSTSIFHNQSLNQPIIEDYQDPLTNIPENISHQRSAAQHHSLEPDQFINKNKRNSNSNSISSSSEVSPIQSSSGSRFSEDSSDSEDDSVSVRDGFEFDQINLSSSRLSTTNFEPVYLKETFFPSSSRSGSYHSQDDVISPSWRPDGKKLETRSRDLAVAKDSEGKPFLLKTRISSQMTLSKGSNRQLTLEETRDMLESAWREEFDRQKLHQLGLEEERKIKTIDQEIEGSDFKESIFENQTTRNDQESHSNDETNSNLQKTVRAKVFRSHTKSLDSNSRFNTKPHALNHIKRIIPPKPLASNSNSNSSYGENFNNQSFSRLGHRYTSSLPQNTFFSNPDLEDFYLDRRDSLMIERRNRLKSRETIPLSAFDHTIISDKRPGFQLQEPSFLALPSSAQTAQTELQDSITENDFYHPESFGNQKEIEKEKNPTISFRMIQKLKMKFKSRKNSNDTINNNSTKTTLSD